MIVAIAIADFSVGSLSQSSTQAQKEIKQGKQLIKSQSEYDQDASQSVEKSSDIHEDSRADGDKVQSIGRQDNQEQDEGVSQTQEIAAQSQQPYEKQDSGDNQTEQTTNTALHTESSSGYISFKKDDRIVVKFQSESGWWWGCMLGVRNPVDGYFPASYVKFSHQLEAETQSSKAESTEKAIEKMDWNEYAILLKQQAKETDLNDDTRQKLEDLDDRDILKEGHLKPGIKGYKRVKVDPEKEQNFKGIPGAFFNKEGDTVFIPIKSQDPNDRACRQLNYYFDYDKWNDQMNQQNGKLTNKPRFEAYKKKQQQQLKK